MEDINTQKLNFDNKANSVMEFECYFYRKRYNSEIDEWYPYVRELLEVNHTHWIIHDSIEDRTERELSRSSGRENVMILSP